MTRKQVFRFDVEGQEVVCYQTGGDRLWRCERANFERTLRQRQQAFCPHAAVAIMHWMQGDYGDAGYG